jgi:hypothetical protein
MRHFLIGFITVLIFIFGLFFLVKVTNAATTFVQVFNGGTGTTTTPSYGQLLIGGKNGEYEYVASSTFGGSGGGGGGSGTVTNIATTYPILGGPITTSGTLSLAFSTTTANLWSGLQSFSNSGTTTFAGGIYANSIVGPYLLATSTTATSTFNGNVNILGNVWQNNMPLGTSTATI